MPGARAIAGVLVAALALACSDAGRPGDPGPERLPWDAELRPEAETGEMATLEDVARAYATDLAREPVETDWSGGDAGSGAALYAQHCALCHGASGAGDGLAAAALNPKPRDFRDGTFYIDASANHETGEDVDLARVILEGPGAFGGSQAMQGWKAVLSADEIRDLIAFIRSLSA